MLVTYHACPNDCILYRNTQRYDHSKLECCPTCQSPCYDNQGHARKKFHYYPVEQHFQRIFGDAEISKIIQSHIKATSTMTNQKVMRGIQDSPCFRALFSASGYFGGNHRGLVLQLSSDGVSPFDASQYSMWPTVISVLNLPKKVRNLYSNIMLVGIVPGFDKSA